MLKEFKSFALKGNMIDMAVGIIIGAAFTSVVSSLVKDILSPPLGLLTGGTDFSSLVWVLKPEIGESAAITVNYGLFINAIISFLLVTGSVFLIVKALSKAQKKEEKKEATKPSEDILLLREIRDSLKKK